MPPTMHSDAVNIRILNVAQGLFSQRTVAGTKMTEIASEAQVSRGTLHARFRTKDDLLRAVIIHELRDLHKTVPAPSGTTLAQLQNDLESLAQAYFDFYTKRSFIMRVLPTLDQNEELVRVFHAEQAHTVSRLTILYATYRDKGVWAPPIQEVDLQGINEAVSLPFLGGIYTRITFSLIQMASLDTFDAHQYTKLFLYGYANWDSREQPVEARKVG